MAFRAGTPFIGGLDRAFLQGILSDISTGIGNPNPLAPTIPETVYMCFQMTFAIITPALIAGAFAERMKFSAMLWFIGLWAICVYAPIAHWVWGPDGFLNSGNDAAWIKVLDFAGGTVVHVNAGVAGLMCALDARQAQGHRAGAQRRADLHRRLAAVGRLVRLQCRLGGHRRHAGGHGDDGDADRHRHRRRSPGCSSSGRRAASRPSSASARARSRAWSPSRPASGFVGPVGSLAIGVAGGRRLLSRRRPAVKALFGYDDALDCFGVHAVGGAAGAILTGVFAISEYGGTSGLIEGNGGQVHQPVRRRRHRHRLRRDRVARCILKIIDAVVGCASIPRSSRTGSTSRLHGETVQ